MPALALIAIPGDLGADLDTVGIAMAVVTIAAAAVGWLLWRHR